MIFSLIQHLTNIIVTFWIKKYQYQVHGEDNTSSWLQRENLQNNLDLIFAFSACNVQFIELNSNFNWFALNKLDQHSMCIKKVIIHETLRFAYYGTFFQSQTCLMWPFKERIKGSHTCNTGSLLIQVVNTTDLTVPLTFWHPFLFFFHKMNFWPVGSSIGMSLFPSDRQQNSIKVSVVNSPSGWSPLVLGGLWSSYCMCPFSKPET